MSQKSILSDKKAIVEHVTDFVLMVIMGVVFFLVMGVWLTRGVGQENKIAIGEVQTTATMENLLHSYRTNFEQGLEINARELQKQMDYVWEQGSLPENSLQPPPGARVQK